ncbi:hypothetical protein BJ944DRAFT_251537 [Cunninghamella echinulata]|nr:hypothetical protein BJ944DRAFT_251537 [Cunninghamella echinulata]
MHLTTVILIFTSFLTNLVSAIPLTKRAPATVIESCSVPGTFALSFDDGPNAYTWELIKYLNQENIKATFFINGNNTVDVSTGSTNTPDGVKTYLDHIRLMHEHGHQVASHTNHHVHLDASSPETIRLEMNQVSDIIYSAIQLRPRYMRPPYGERNDNTLAVLGELKYQVITWDVDPNDYNQTIPYETKQSTVSTSLDQEQNTPPTSSHIILMHDIHQQTVQELTPFVIEKVRTKGYKFTTVAECLNDSNPYTT